MLRPLVEHLPEGAALRAQICAMREHGRALLKAGKVGLAEKILDEALEKLDPEAEPELAASLFGELGAVLEAKGDFQGAAVQMVECFRRMESRAAEDPDFYWEHLNRLGRVSLRLGQSERARELFTKAREHARQVGSAVGEVKATTNLAGVAAGAGELDVAELLFYEALKIAEQVGDRLGAARVYYNTARLGRAPKPLTRAGSASR